MLFLAMADERKAHGEQQREHGPECKPDDDTARIVFGGRVEGHQRGRASDKHADCCKPPM